MAWIPMIPEDKAEKELKDWYDKLREPWGGVDNILRIHSINIPTLKGHYELYQSAMKGTRDLTGKQREMIAVVVSTLNGEIFRFRSIKNTHNILVVILHFLNLSDFLTYQKAFIFQIQELINVYMSIFIFILCNVTCYLIIMCVCVCVPKPILFNLFPTLFSTFNFCRQSGSRITKKQTYPNRTVRCWTML